MKKSEFLQVWNKHFPKSLPIPSYFQFNESKWFRIHSLPNSKRYADTEEELQIILNRQNQLFEDLFEEGSEIAISLALFKHDLTIENFKKLSDFGEFELIHSIDLKSIYPSVYEDEMLCDIYVKVMSWKRNSLNELLKGIANDEIRAIFFCPFKERVIMPYDGGVDVIMDSIKKREIYMDKYRDFLSQRADML